MFNLIEPNIKYYHMSQVEECKINYGLNDVTHMTYLISIIYIYWVYHVKIFYPILYQPLILLVKKEKLFPTTTILMGC